MIRILVITAVVVITLCQGLIGCQDFGQVNDGSIVADLDPTAVRTQAKESEPPGQLRYLLDQAVASRSIDAGCLKYLYDILPTVDPNNPICELSSHSDQYEDEVLFQLPSTSSSDMSCDTNRFLAVRRYPDENGSYPVTEVFTVPLWFVRPEELGQPAWSAPSSIPKGKGANFMKELTFAGQLGADVKLRNITITARGKQWMFGRYTDIGNDLPAELINPTACEAPGVLWDGLITSTDPNTFKGFTGMYYRASGFPQGGGLEWSWGDTWLFSQLADEAANRETCLPNQGGNEIAFQASTSTTFQNLCINGAVPYSIRVGLYMIGAHLVTNNEWVYFAPNNGSYAGNDCADIALYPWPALGWSWPVSGGIPLNLCGTSLNDMKKGYRAFFQTFQWENSFEDLGTGWCGGPGYWGFRGLFYRSQNGQGSCGSAIVGDIFTWAWSQPGNPNLYIKAVATYRRNEPNNCL